jgi:DNA-binding MarR family transcriptional regulator
MENLRTTFQLLSRRFGLLSENCCDNCCGQDISLVQSHIIYEIRRQHNPSMQDVANALAIDITTFSRQIKTLVEKGLVKKTTDPSDNRIHILSLTSVGESMDKQIDGEVNGYLEQILGQFSDFERQSVINSMNLLEKAMQKSDICCIPFKPTSNSCCFPPK